MPEENGGNTNNTAVIERELQLLGAIQVIKFAASPASLQPFQSTTVSYQVKLPASLSLVTFSINGQSLGHALQGSANFTLTSSTTFELHAATNITARNIASTQATVDQSRCRTGSIAGLIITATLKSSLDQSFAGRTTGTGSVVTLGIGTISIQIPLTLGSGNGTMNLAIQLGVAQNGQSISVTDNSVGVQVHLETDLNVDSWCSNAMQQVVQPFLQHIVDAEIIPALSQQITGQVNELIQSAEQSDFPSHRGFQLTSFQLTEDGASFTVCPTSPGIVVGGTHTNA